MLKGTIDREAGALGRLAEWFVALAAEGTLQAAVRYPFDSDVLANLEIGVGVLANGDDLASTFVASDLWSE